MFISGESGTGLLAAGIPTSLLDQLSISPATRLCQTAPHHPCPAQTTLAVFLKSLVARRQDTHTLGKFHFHQSPKPYSGIVTAFWELCA